MKSLVTEDDATITDLLQLMLLPYGPTDKAYDGTEAIQAFQNALEAQAPYDIILLDIDMPIMDGFETVAEIRKIESERGLAPENRIKVFMISGLGDTEKSLSALNPNWDGYIIKPFRRRTVLEAIAKVIPLPDVHL